MKMLQCFFVAILWLRLSLLNSLLRHVYGYYLLPRQLFEFFRSYATLPPLLWSICVTVPFVW